LISFEISKQFFFPHPCFLLSALLTRAAQHPAAHQRPVTARAASILLCLADKWGRVVIPSAGSHPRARLGSDRAGRASTLRPSPWPWARMPRRPPLGLFSHHRRSSLRFLPLTATPKALPSQTLGRRRRRFSQSPPLLQRGVAPVVRVEVRKPHGLLVHVPVQCAVRRNSLESQPRRRPPSTMRVAVVACPSW
jgi:hypothetical protein